jgi:hypothetical protein
MICLRCGQCCRQLDILIVNPRSILIDGRLDPKDLEAMILKPAGESCTHLTFESKLAVCSIHHLPCYQGTPCQRFEQIGLEDAVCILSGYFKVAILSKS